MKIQTVKLKTGDEFVGQVEVKGKTLHITKAVVFMPAQEGDGTFYPWLLTADLEMPIEIDMENVILITDSVESLVEGYTQNILGIKPESVSAEIVLPQESKIFTG